MRDISTATSGSEVGSIKESLQHQIDATTPQSVSVDDVDKLSEANYSYFAWNGYREKPRSK